MKTRGFAVAALALVAGGLSTTALAQNVVVDWNQALLDSISASNTAPPAAARQMAMTQLAVFEAVNSIDRTFNPYASYIPCPNPTSKEAAAATAAHRVLSTLYPARTATFDSLLNQHLGNVADAAQRSEGVSLGSTAGNAILAQRTNDGSAGNVSVPDGTNPGEWRRTAPSFANPALPHWRYVTPFAISSATAFRPPAPPSLTSAEYTAAYNEVKELGSINSATRTQYQTDTAFLWRAGGNTVTPPGQWNQVAQQVATGQNLSIVDSARLFALLGMAEADAGIVAWEAKYADLLWRPITGIREGDNDTNPDTVGDANWTPLFATPNHPSYTSGHSTFSAAAAAILTQFTGSDNFTFTVTGDNVTRQYTSFSTALADAGMSRIYGGIHWQFDNIAGKASGWNVGREVFGTQLTAVPAPAASGVLLTGLGLIASRRRRNTN
jgi:membrane-associated phospholipid phosphatase